MKTFDFDETEVDRLREACERMSELLPDGGEDWDRLRQRLDNPTCEIHERLVVTPHAFL
jgi:hypothetical protein